MKNARHTPRCTHITFWVLTLVGGFLLACSYEAPDPGHSPPATEPAPISPAKAESNSSEKARDTRAVESPGRLVIRNANLRMRTEDPAIAAAKVEELVVARGGYVQSKQTEHHDDAVVLAKLDLRVPEERFVETLVLLRRQGSVLGESATGQDVTEEYMDTGARLKAKNLLEGRLLEMVESAKSVEDMLKVEQELSRVRTDIEQLTGRMKYLETQAAMATIMLELVSPVQPRTADGESIGSKFRNSIAQAGAAAVSVTTGALVVIGAVIPLLIPAVFVAMLVALRRRRRLSLEPKVG